MKAAWMEPKITELSILRGTKTIGRHKKDCTCNEESSGGCDSSGNGASISASSSESIDGESSSND